MYFSKGLVEVQKEVSGCGFSHLLVLQGRILDRKSSAGFLNACVQWDFVTSAS